MDRSTITTLETLNEPYTSPSEALDDDRLVHRDGEPAPIAIARLLWPRRRDIAKAGVIGLVLATIFAFLIPSTYDATVRLMPPDSSAVSGSSAMLGLMLGVGSSSSSGGGTGAGGLASTVGDLLGTQKPGPLFIGILSSRTVSDSMIDRFDLRKVYGCKTYAAARRKLFSRTTFQEDKKSGLITITVKDRDRYRATAMPEAYVEELNNLLSHVNTSAASREREFLEKRLVDANSELQDASKKLSEFSSKNATLDPEDQGKAMLDSAAMLEGQLIAAKSELSGLKQIYTPENVRVRSLQANIEALEKQVNDMGGKDYSGSTTLDSKSLYPSIRQLPILGREYADLYRRAKVDEIIFEMLTESYEMAKVQEAKETPSVKILDHAKTPEKPDWPPRLWFAAIGAFLGVLGGVGKIWMEKHWATIDPNEPYKALLEREILPVLREKMGAMRRPNSSGV